MRERSDEAAVRLGGGGRGLGGELGEILTLQGARADRFDPAFRFVVFADVDAAGLRGNVDEDLAQRHRRRLGEFFRVPGVILPRFFFGDRELRSHFLALDLLDEHLALQLLPQVVHRHAFLREGGLELRLVGESLLLADVGDDRLELIVAELEAELLAALQEQQLVDRVHEELRRELGERLLERLVVLQRFGINLLSLHALPEGRHLPRLELGLRDDLAVHLHEHLLDDLRAHRHDHGGRKYDRRREKLFLHYFQYLSVSERPRSSRGGDRTPG